MNDDSTSFSRSRPPEPTAHRSRSLTLRRRTGPGRLGDTRSASPCDEDRSGPDLRPSLRLKAPHRKHQRLELGGAAVGDVASSASARGPSLRLGVVPREPLHHPASGAAQFLRDRDPALACEGTTHRLAAELLLGVYDSMASLDGRVGVQHQRCRRGWDRVTSRRTSRGGNDVLSVVRERSPAGVS